MEVDAKSEIMTRQAFEVIFSMPALTPQWLKSYIDSRLTELNLENQIE